jgi:hypothetical protein
VIDGKEERIPERGAASALSSFIFYSKGCFGGPFLMVGPVFTYVDGNDFILLKIKR